jgi:hypothetical protein
MTTLFLALLSALAASPARAAASKLGPEWDQIKAAESSMKSGSFVDAEGDLKKALDMNPDEPKITEDLALVHVVFDELPAAKSELEQAIEISKRKQAKFKKGGHAYAAWKKYLADLYSELTEITILENEKVLRAGLGPKGKIGPNVQKALSRVREVYNKTRSYGVFKSRVDDDLIGKAISALNKKPGSAAVAAKKGAKPAAEDAGAGPDNGAPEGGAAAKAAPSGPSMEEAGAAAAGAGPAGAGPGDAAAAKPAEKAAAPAAQADAGGGAGGLGAIGGDDASKSASKPAVKDADAGNTPKGGGPAVKQADVVNAMAPGGAPEKKPADAAASKQDASDPFGGGAPAAPAGAQSAPDKPKPAGAAPGGGAPGGGAPGGGAAAGGAPGGGAAPGGKAAGDNPFGP